MKLHVWMIAGILAVGCSHKPATTAQADTKKEAAASGKAAPTAANTAAASQSDQVVEGVACSHGKDLRRLDVHPVDKGCTLTYTKHEKGEQIAAARMGVQFCQEKLKKVRATLEGSGFKCE